MRLFCFPYAGAESRIFRDWQEQLAPWGEVVAVELPGRGGHQDRQPFTRLAPLADALFAALAPLFERPFALFGHSMGALLAFEIARRALHGGLPCSLLFASAHRPPHLAREGAPLHALDDDALVEELRRLNGTPEPVLQSPELLALYLPIVRADLAACETYRYLPAPPLDCPIVALGGLRDRTVSPEALEGWRAQTASSFLQRMFPGDHFFLHRARDALLHEIARELRRVGASAKDEARR